MINYSLSPYRTYFALPDVKATLAVTFLARLPVGMMSLAMLMMLRDTLGNFKLAGAVVGAYFFSMAVAAPVQGRIIDRIGPMLPLKITGVGEPLFFGLFIFAAWQQLSMPLIYASAIAMGIFSPPITVLTRTLLRHRFDSDDDRRMAFSVDAILMEINFTMGPAIVGILLAFTNPRVAVLAAWLALVISISAFLLSPLLKYWKQEPSVERHLLGPLTDPQLVWLFIAVLGLATACGMLEVGYPAYATWLTTPAFAGVMLSMNSLGSVAGGVVFGATKLKLPLNKQFALLLALFGAFMFLHLAVDARVTVIGFAVVAFIAGAAISPAFAAQALMVSRLAPAKYATEAFTWSGTFIVTGLGAGMAIGGALSEIYHVKAPFVAGGAVLLAVAALALALKTDTPK